MTNARRWSFGSTSETTVVRSFSEVPTCPIFFSSNATVLVRFSRPYVRRLSRLTVDVALFYIHVYIVMIESVARWPGSLILHLHACRQE
jgi:hypothetical protein